MCVEVVSMSSGEIVISDAEVATDYVKKSVAVQKLIDDRGDEEALREVAKAAGLGFWTCWGLFQRRRKTAGGSEIGKLKGAYLALCEAAVNKLQAEIAGERDKGGDAASTNRIPDFERSLSRLAMEIQEARKAAY